MDISELKQKIRLDPYPFVVLMDKLARGAWLKVRTGVDVNLEEIEVPAIYEAIKKTGLKNLKIDNLDEILQQVAEGELVCIAEAIEPQHGQNGYIDCNFVERLAEQMWKDDDSAKIDFRKRNEINNVSEGDLLATLVDPSEPKDGMNVLGRPIVAKKGRRARLIPGSNVRLSEDKKQVFSEIEGCVKRVRSRISVDKVKYIRGDVDFRSGSIQFKGDVVVDGDVKETFDIEAEGSIRIGGTVDRAALKAGGDILIDGGLYGKDDIEVLAEGDLSLGFAENANLKAGGDIYVKSALVNCDTLSQQKIHLKATGKALIGGHTIATHGLDANSLGNPRIPTKTLIEFGLRPELSQKLRGLKLEFQRSDEARQKEIREEIGSLAEEYELQTRARVIARHITYPGVILVCEKASFEVYNEISRMMYYKVKGKNEISMRGYGPAKKAAVQR